MRFDIDANGILSVTATDKGTGKQTDIKITGASTLPSDEVEKMVKDAEKNAEGGLSQRAARREGGRGRGGGPLVDGWQRTGVPGSRLAGCVPLQQQQQQPVGLETRGPASPCPFHLTPRSPPTPCLPPLPACLCAEDRKARELIDTKNQADSMVYQTEKQVGGPCAALCCPRAALCCCPVLLLYAAGWPLLDFPTFPTASFPLTHLPACPPAGQGVC